MKANFKILAIVFALIIPSIFFTKQLSAQQPSISFQVFYDQLSPYGEWVDYPNYGYVWIPDGGSDFAPYSTAGHWIFTEYGWTWASDYDWGWAPFHYGRWDYDNYYGWFWVPDNEWGPAWVNWRVADGYYGWAPMEPGVTINISFYREYNDRPDHWIFVRNRDLGRPHISQYSINRNDHERIIRNSTVVRNTYTDRNRNTTYVSGPSREEVQKSTGRRVSNVSVQENINPGQSMRRGQLQIYRPQVYKNNERDQRVAPTKVTNIRDMKEASQRRTNNQPKNINTNNRQEQKSNTVRTTKNSKEEHSRKTNTEEKRKRAD